MMLYEDLKEFVDEGMKVPEHGFSADHFRSVYGRIMEQAGCDAGKLLSLLTYAMDHDFFRGPASTQFHGNCAHGLALHSLGVMGTAMELLDGFGLRDSLGNAKWVADFTVSCLFHDLCKAGLYEVSTRNVKDEQGIWRKEPFYKVKGDATAVGHGTESLRRISKFVSLDYGWELAVAWHMGSFGLGSTENIQYVNSCKAHREVLLLHTADMLQVSKGGA